MSTTIHKHPPLQLPCLALTGTKIFTSTADQRYFLGSDEFLRTHFPVQLLSYRADSQITLTEQDLLQQILEHDISVTGNRVFILYGAAGSGKSELLRWLQTHIHLQDALRASITARIARTDLDIFHIVQRLQETYSLSPLQDTSLKRWEECCQKPRTLAKIIVLSALEQLLDSDEQVNALYYQLIDIVQSNLERCFASMSQPSEDMGKYIELFSREDLQEILRTSVVPVSIEYETLRFYLLKVFREQLLEGLDFSYTLQQIAHDVQREKGQRPILLIDDLVQSINLFATDLLDYFITLEEGCWDVVIGITPNSLESTLRGKELLDRITYLDTIDDRVQKVWLSDEYGLSSSFLNETNCAEYARLYLSEYKRQNAQLCDETCPAFHRCRHLEPDRSENLLAPFNQEVLIRLFRSLPKGKGRARYFTSYLRDILLRFAQGEDLLKVMQEYIKAEWAVYYSDKKLTQVYELYGSFLQDGNTSFLSMAENEHLHQFFEIEFSHQHRQLPIVASLYKQSSETTPTNNRPTLDPGKEAIKAWLQGESVNKQLLRNIRRGMLKAVKEAYPLDAMTRLHTAKPQRVLRWARTRLDTVPPVALEGIDDFEGLRVERAIGPFAYILHDFADAGGWSELDLRNSLLSHEAFPTFLFDSLTYRTNIQNDLEKQLGMRIEEFAFSLFMLALCFNRFPVELPAPFRRKIDTEVPLSPKYPDGLETARPRLVSSQVSVIKRFFDDCFKLRENVYDGLLLEQIMERISVKRAFELLQSIDVANIENDYRLNEEPLGKFVEAIQQAILMSLAQLRTNSKVKTKLIAICETGLGTDRTSSLFASLVGLPGNSEERIDLFLQRCTPLELHQALCLVHSLDLAQHEQLLLQLRSLLIEANDSESEETAHITKGFSQEEIKTLISFFQQDFYVPLSQIEMPLLVKVSQHMPGLYHRLELRFQRG